MATMKQLQQMYAKASWLEAMSGLGPNQAGGFAHMVGNILEDGALPAKIKHFILFVTFVHKRFEPFAQFHAVEARKAGATSEEWNEVLLTAILSRGPMVYAEGARILGLVQGTPNEPKEPTMTAPVETATEILQKFEKDFGGGAAWLKLLEKHSPTVLEGYFWMRSGVMTDGVLPRKYKEMLLVGLNAAERYHTGMEVHARFALSSGASREELQEAMVTAIIGGGMPAWLEASAIYEKVVAELEK